MWTCPECGREFKRRGQNHSCGEKIASVERYIALQSPERQPELRRLRELFRRALPEATERMAWGMPGYWQGRYIIHFAAAQRHIGIYPGPAAIAHFKEALGAYKTSKGSISIPYGKTDEALLAAIAVWCLEHGGRAD